LERNKEGNSAVRFRLGETKELHALLSVRFTIEIDAEFPIGIAALLPKETTGKTGE
jgi:hypothetical protein